MWLSFSFNSNSNSNNVDLQTPSEKSMYSRIRTKYGEILCLSLFNLNAGKCGPE